MLQRKNRYISSKSRHSASLEPALPTNLGTPNEPQQLPARVLEVLGQDGTETCGLVATQRGQKGIYTTLSHCWGAMDRSLATSISNIKDRSIYVDEGSLPKVFQEAISVSRYLAIRYLWVDMLCIIQDCQIDWRKESESMYSTYQNCTFTIMATDGAKLGRRGPTPHTSFVNHPLMSRAWIFQEGLLGPRTIQLRTGSAI